MRSLSVHSMFTRAIGTLMNFVSKRSQIQDNSTLPTTISSIRILNATNTRRSFLDRIFNPIISANQDRPLTLAEAIQEVSIGAGKLHKLGSHYEY